MLERIFSAVASERQCEKRSTVRRRKERRSREAEVLRTSDCYSRRQEDKGSRWEKRRDRRTRVRRLVVAGLDSKCAENRDQGHFVRTASKKRKVWWWTPKGAPKSSGGAPGLAPMRAGPQT